MHPWHEFEHEEGRPPRKGSVSTSQTRDSASTGLRKSLTQHFILRLRRNWLTDDTDSNRLIINRHNYLPLPTRASTNMYSFNFGTNLSETEPTSSLDKPANLLVFILRLDLTPVSFEVERF